MGSKSTACKVEVGIQVLRNSLVNLGFVGFIVAGLSPRLLDVRGDEVHHCRGSHNNGPFCLVGSWDQWKGAGPFWGEENTMRCGHVAMLLIFKFVSRGLVMKTASKVNSPPASLVICAASVILYSPASTGGFTELLPCGAADSATYRGMVKAGRVGQSFGGAGGEKNNHDDDDR